MVLLHACRLQQFCRCGVEFACKMCVRDLAELCPEVSRYFFAMFSLIAICGSRRDRAGERKMAMDLFCASLPVNFAFFFGAVRALFSAGHLYRTM